MNALRLRLQKLSPLRGVCTHARAHMRFKLKFMAVVWPEKIRKLPSSADDKCVPVRCNDKHTASAECITVCAFIAMVMKVRIRITSTHTCEVLRREITPFVPICTCARLYISNDSKWRQYWHLKWESYIYEILKRPGSKNIIRICFLFPFHQALFICTVIWSFKCN